MPPRARAPVFSNFNGERFRELRISRGLQLRDIAKNTKITPSTLAFIEANETIPTDAQIDAIAEFFGVPETELLISPTPTLRQLRLRQGLGSQIKQLSAACKFPSGYLAALEAGEIGLTRERAARLAAHLKVPTNTVIDAYKLTKELAARRRAAANARHP
jgi:transcriptional regulator with XRE-family HTH domain